MPSPIYNTTDGNSLDFTNNGTHGVSGNAHTVRGGINASEDSGMSAEVIAIPNVGRKMNAPDAHPSPVAGTMFDGDHTVVNPMDTD